MQTETTITYKQIADALRPKYRIQSIIRVCKEGRKRTGIRFHVNSIVAQENLDYVKGLFEGINLRIFYDNNSGYLYIEIPE